MHYLQIALKAEDLYDKVKVGRWFVVLAFLVPTSSSQSSETPCASQSLVRLLLRYLAHAMRVTVPLEAIALVAIALSNGSDAPDWEDFIGIVLLLLASSAIRRTERWERHQGSHGFACTRGQGEAHC